MSTDWHLVCTSHTPHLSSIDPVASGEGLPRVVAAMRDLRRLVPVLNLIQNYGSIDDHRHSVAVYFLAAHPDCEVVLEADDRDGYWPLDFDGADA